MSEVLRLYGLGAAVDVQVGGAAADPLAAAMRRSWSRCLTPHGSRSSVVLAEPVTVQLDEVCQLPAVLMETTQRVTRALIGARSGQLLMFHAGAVAHPETGRSLVYVAPGGTGKTTLSRLLGQRFGYLTDETVGIDDAGGIHPYPKPLSVRRTEQPKVKDELSPDDLGLRPAPPASRVSRLVLLERRADLGEPHLEELPFMDAVLALAAQTSGLPALPRPLHRLADLVDEVGPVARLRYREATQLEGDLVTTLGGVS